MNRKALMFLVSLLIFHSSVVFAAEYQIYWGDIHFHTSYSDDAYIIQDDLGRTPGRPDAALLYASDVASLDFAALTDHAEHIELYRDREGNLIPDAAGNPIDEWQDSIVQTAPEKAPAGMVVFLGFEYTKTAEDEARNPVPGAGHKCVIFKNGVPPLPISAVQGKPLAGSPYAALPSDLWNTLDAGGYEYMTIPHHPAKGTSAVISPETNMSTDWNYVNAQRQPLVEVFSVHGSSDYSGCPDEVDGFLPERSVESALNLWLTTGNPGYQMGLVGSTDGHLSRPGSVEPESPDNMVHQEGDFTGGLVAALATGKTRDALWDALTHRRAYGTSGPRIKIHKFSILYKGKTYMMGETVPCKGDETPQITLEVDVETDTNDPEILVITKSTQEEPVSEGVLPSTGQPWILQTAADHALCTVWDGKRVTLRVTDTITSVRSYYRLTVRQKPTTRYTWNTFAREYQQIQTKERAWSSPIFVFLSPVLYVSRSDPTCGGKSPCYQTIQGALNDAPDGAVIKIAAGTYPEELVKGNAGSVSFSCNWNESFTSRTEESSTSANSLNTRQGTLNIDGITLTQ